MKADFRHIAIDTLTDFAEQNKEMSLGDILYSSLRNSLTGLNQQTEKGEDISIKGLHNLRRLSDKQIYDAIEKAMKDERE